MRRRDCFLHGRRVSWLEAGPVDGPVLLLVHGIGASAQTWGLVGDALAAEHRVLAIDLPGHGESEEPPGDYSLGASASTLRDLLVYLSVPSVTIVGHSLGGGVAMQFAYQFPERLARLVLISSGGLGRDVSLALRAAALPGAGTVLTLAGPVLSGLGPLSRVLGQRGAGPALVETLDGVGSLARSGPRRAFLAALRGVVDTSGQRVSGVSKLYLASEIPTLLIAGGRDSIIPPDHSRAAHELIAGSELLLLPRCGHFPQAEDPQAVVSAIADFVATRPAAANDPQRWTEVLVRQHDDAATRAAAVPGVED